MFRSTMNPDLVVGAPSKYGERNYFMISRAYCHLNSNLGYHFSTMEAMVGERASENYVSFQFKGGAADDDRRVKRLHLIEAILEDRGFRVELNEDNLLARAEGRDQTWLSDRLAVLGYLTLHTRQLDMVMSSQSSMRRYRSRIEQDLNALLHTGGSEGLGEPAT